MVPFKKFAGTILYLNHLKVIRWKKLQKNA